MTGRGWAAVAAATILVAAWLASGGPDPVPTTAVRRGDLPLAVEAAGELDAVRSSLIGPPAVPRVWEFKLASIAPESREVKRGQPILSFDASRLQDELRTRRVEHDVAVKDLEKKETELAVALRELDMSLAEAESRLGKATLKADRPEELAAALDLRLARLDRELAGKEVASLRRRVEARRRAAEADIRSLREKRDLAASRMAELEASIARMTVEAPQDGIVVYQTNWQGEKKKVGDTVWAQEKVLKIPDLSEMKGRAEVDEAEAGRLAPGQPATIRLDALPDAEISGRLSSLGRVVRQRSRDNPQKIYTVEIALDRTDPARMRPGMRLRAEIEVERAAGVLLAPREAIFLRAAGPVAFVRRGRGFVETPVRLGRHNAREVEILEGLAEGDLVARRDPTRAAPGESS